MQHFQNGRSIPVHQRGILWITAAEDPHIRFCRRRPAGFLQHLDRRLIDIDQRARADIFSQQLKQRLTGLCRLHRPVAHGRPADFNAEPGKLLLLAVKRQRISKLASEDMGQQSCTGYPFRDDLRRNRGDLYGRAVIFHPFTTPAAVFGSDMSDDPDNGRDDIELLRYLLTDTLKRCTAAADLFLFVDVMDHVHPGKILWERFSARFLSGMRFNLDLLFGLSLSFRVDLGHIEQQQLRAAAEQLLALTAEQSVEQLKHLFAQQFVFRLVLVAP